MLRPAEPPQIIDDRADLTRHYFNVHPWLQLLAGDTSDTGDTGITDITGGRADLAITRAPWASEPRNRGALIFSAEGARGFAAGRFILAAAPPVHPPDPSRRGRIFNYRGADSVDLENGRIRLSESTIYNGDLVGTRPVRVRQPFDALIALLIDLGERRLRWHGATPRPNDPPIDRVVIANDRAVAVLQDNSNMSWRWTVFELP